MWLSRPVVRISPYRPDPQRGMLELRDSVVRYEAPLEPVGVEDWESLE